MKSISVARDFSKYPGGRFKRLGPNSGEEFRDKILLPAFSIDSDESILVDLDGVVGYGVSFLEEAFGGLGRLLGPQKVLSRLEIRSDRQPFLKERVLTYIRECNERPKAMAQ